ncbi:single-strand DNA-binding protein [Leifsonia sp. AK011]|uniref:single-stranded DNA-binding protein n=1 Tax=Leifsonia sp. AK011 TaxID=2723075 RepID=UPI0015CE3266|nr:single-stranded DNA-binding protein [Leifsonia sp. AK011]NYF11099.1 single-strand DNA-binding protein [Leifsonia sp. AK011]
MTDTITLTGLVATDPKHIVTSEGLAITNFRLASTQRRYDKNEGKWVDAETNWYTVTCFRQLAINASASLSKGERVLVTGRLKLRSWDTGERSGMSVDVEADALGHDLLWGSTTFARSMSASKAQTAPEPQQSQPVSPPEHDSFEPSSPGQPAPEPAF